MAQDPAEADVVSAQETIEDAFRKTVGAAMMTCVALQKKGAHHRRRSQRDEERNTDGYAEHDGEFAKETSDDTAHHQDGDKDSNERGAHGKDCEADLARAFNGGFPGAHAGFDVTCDVFDDHDGVVDDETSTDGEGHEREIVERVVAQIHDAESADEGERHGDTGNDGGPVTAQEHKDHQNYEGDGNDQGDFDVVHRGTDGGGAVNCHVQMQ